MNLTTINDLTKKDILQLFTKADSFRLGKQKIAQIDTTILTGLLFFQPSTRTRVGFETAAWKLGYKSIVLDETKPSVAEGWSESMADTIRTMNAYVDAYFIRHPDNDVFNEVLPYTNKPVINCGNGYDEHPTQALIDAYAIWKKFERLDDLTITFIGDARYSRAAHSLTLLLAKFAGNSICQIAPQELRLPDKYTKSFYDQKRVHVIAIEDLGSEQILYSTGFPPINPSGTFSQNIVRKFIITENVAARLQDDAIIMNPLPRIDEIDTAVDASPKAYYFRENELGLYMRMAIMKNFIPS